MPSTTITISREQRQPLHRLVTQHISGIGDVDMKLSAGYFAAAESLGLEYSERHQHAGRPRLEPRGRAPVIRPHASP
jgi:hypothetical protein